MRSFAAAVAVFEGHEPVRQKVETSEVAARAELVRRSCLRLNVRIVRTSVVRRGAGKIGRAAERQTGGAPEAARRQSVTASQAGRPILASG